MAKALLISAFVILLATVVYSVDPLDPAHNSNILPANVAFSNYTAPDSDNDSDYADLPNLQTDDESDDEPPHPLPPQQPPEHYSSDDDDDNEPIPQPTRFAHVFRYTTHFSLSPLILHFTYLLSQRIITGMCRSNGQAHRGY